MFARGDFVKCFPKFSRVATVFLNEEELLKFCGKEGTEK